MTQLASNRGRACLATLLGLLLLLLPAAAAPVWALPLLTLTVTTGDSPAHVGDTVEFVFTATNNGSTPLTGLVVTGNLCDSAPKYVSGDSSGIDSFDPDESWIYQCVHVISELPKSIEMSAGASGTPEGGGSLETASATTTVEVFHPAVKVDASINSLFVGTKVVYGFVVLNIGDTPLSQASVSSAQCLTAMAGPTGDDGDGELAPDAMEGWFYECDGPVVGASDTTFHVEASVEAQDGLGRTVSATGSGDMKVVHPAITFTSAATPTTAHPGDTITFTYKLTDTGDTHINTTTVTFTACDTGTFKYGDADDNGALDPGESWNGSCTHKVTESVGATVKNTFTFSGEGGFSLDATASASVTITAKATPKPSAPPTAEPTDEPTTSPTEPASPAASFVTATAPPSTTAAPSAAPATQEPSAPASTEGSAMPLLLVAGLVVLVAALGGWFAWQRRRSTAGGGGGL